MVIMCLRRDRINSPHRGRASTFQARICFREGFTQGYPKFVALGHGMKSARYYYPGLTVGSSICLV